MKLFLYIFLGVSLIGVNLFSEEFTTGGVYVQVASKDQTCNLISKATTSTEPLVVGKTYHLETEVLEIPTKSEAVSLFLSTGLQLKIQPNSTFSLDTFNQLVKNYENQPEILKAEYAITMMSLMDGELEVVSPKMDQNSQCILQTPLVNVHINEGRLSIKSTSKYVIINSIDGIITVVDSTNKKSTVDKGNLGLIIPYPGKAGEIMVTQKPISDDELQKIKKSTSEMDEVKGSILFAVVDKKVVGIRLK